MSQSALEREILYDHDYQAAHKEANAICMTIERRINSWQEFLVEAEKKIFELHEELAGARKKREEIEAARRSVGVVNDVEERGGNLTVERMLYKIKEALSTIDEMAKLGIVLPDTIGMRLEALIAVPDHAPSEIAASAYLELARHVVTNIKSDPKQFALLERQVLDVVCLTCCRFINPLNKKETRNSFTVAFGGELGSEMYSKLGNSLYQTFMRDLKAHPMQEPGFKHPEEDERARRVRKRVHRVKRTASEPPSESGRVMRSALLVQLQ